MTVNMAKHAELRLEIMQYIHLMLYGHTLFYEYCINLNGENYGLCACLMHFTDHLSVKVKK
jgi:hypothetical protein